MPGSLLGRSAWFLSPLHLRQPRPSDFKPLPFPAAPPLLSQLPADEELFVRECCPVTLGHLLPDLRFTRDRDLEEGGRDFEAGLEDKLRRHLEASHRDLSASSSTMDDDDCCDGVYTGDRVEADVKAHFFVGRHQDDCGGGRVVMRPHKVNYPDVSNVAAAGRMLLPSLTFSSDVDSSVKSSMRGVWKRERSWNPSESQKAVFAGVKKNKLETLECSRSRRSRPKNWKTSFEQASEKQECVRDDVFERVVSRNNALNRSLKSQRPQLEDSDPSRPDSPLRLGANISNQHRANISSQHRANGNSLCVHHRRTRSLSPFKPDNEAGKEVMPPERTNFHIFPSPHLVELARLKKQQLELQEKMMLRQRRKLELERLRPPATKWYEMKDFRFHQEAHKNNTYLRNAKILPLIQQRRRHLIDSLMTMDF